MAQQQAKSATKDELFNALTNIHQIVSDCDTSARTEMINCLDSVTEEVLQVIPDADEYLSADDDDSDDDESDDDEEA